MRLEFHKRFEKEFAKLPEKVKQKANAVIQNFLTNPLDPQLHNHALTGNLKSFLAISVTGDIRIIFEEFNHYTLVILLNVGTHSQVYK